MKKVVILGAGLATRLYPITHHIPKVLVNYGQHTILKHLYNLYTDLGAEKIHVVVHSKFARTVSAYCSQEKLDIEINTVDEAYGSAYAINRIADKLNFHNVVFNWCDVIPEFDAFSWDDDSIYTFGDQCRYNFDGKELKEVGSTGGNVVGVYQCRDFYSKKIESKDEANEVFKGKDFIEILSPKETETFYQNELFNLIDLGDMPKLVAAHNGAVIPREFNSVRITENVVYKQATNEKGIELQEREIAWYNKVNSKHVPEILNYRGQDEGNMITMERIKGKPLYQVFDGEADVDSALDMLESIRVKANFEGDMESDLRYEVIEKVIARCKSIQPVIDSFGEIKFVNGVRIGRLKPMLERAYAHLKEGIEQNYYLIHGDPNFSNIIADESGVLKMIDPRGYFGETELYGPKEYDIAKVLYALTGYDKFNSDPKWGGMSIDGKSMLVDIEPLTDISELTQFNAFHKLWVAVIWVALGGYFKNNPLKAVSAYYYGMKLLTQSLDDLGRRLQDGSTVNECLLTESVLKTKCVDKWLLIDLETGQKYKPNSDVDRVHDWEKIN